MSPTLPGSWDCMQSLGAERDARSHMTRDHMISSCHMTAITTKRNSFRKSGSSEKSHLDMSLQESAVSDFHDDFMPITATLTLPIVDTRGLHIVGVGGNICGTGRWCHLVSAVCITRDLEREPR